MSKGTSVIDYGWKKLYKEVYKNNKEKEEFLPDVKKDDLLNIINAGTKGNKTACVV